MNSLALNEEQQYLQNEGTHYVHHQWSKVHNVYLEYAVDLGIPGLVLFLLLMVSCIKAAAFVRDRSLQIVGLRELAYLAEGIRISLVAFAIAANFYPVAYHLYFYYFAGLALAVKATYEAEERTARMKSH